MSASAAIGNGGVGITVGGAIVESRVVRNGSDGVVALGLSNSAFVDGVVATSNGGAGVSFFADGGELVFTLATRNAGHGYVVHGDAVFLCCSTALKNGGNGFVVSLVFSEFSGLETRDNAGFGIVGGGSDTLFYGNQCDGDGLGDSDPPGLCD